MKNVISKITLLAMGIMATMGLTSCAPATTDAAAPEQGMGGMLSMLVVYGLFFVGIYFVMIKPQSKKRKEEEEMRQSLEIGDEVITIGGVKGRVVSIKDDESFILETGPDRTKILFQKWAISTIVTDKPELNAKADNKKSKKNKVEEK
ncbi:MAG: preprotein translocase subunit YajC [Acutalibacteraceae bacterium]|nr:preprotein translocase subunit YajC [Acutalibacteraceae bacterium]